MRQRVTYCMTGSPTSSVKRAARAEREMASSRASEATVHSRAGSRWIREIARPMCLSWSAPSQPARAAGSVSIQERIAWMTRMSPKPRDDLLAARSQLPRLGGHQPQGALQPLGLRRVRRLHVDRRRERGAEVGRRGMAKAHSAADERRPHATFSVDEDLVPVAHVLPLELEDPGGGNAWRAPESVTPSVRHEREVPDPEERRVCSVGLEPGSARRHDVEPHVVLERRQCQSPVLRVALPRCPSGLRGDHRLVR